MKNQGNIGNKCNKHKRGSEVLFLLPGKLLWFIFLNYVKIYIANGNTNYININVFVLHSTYSILTYISVKPLHV